MESATKIRSIVACLGVVLLQLVMTQVVTFLVSLLVPDMEGFQKAHSALFALVLGATFSTGVVLTGWLALSRGWLNEEPRYLARFVAALVGAYVPLVVALILYPMLEPGNPWFFISMLASTVGFHLPGWPGRE